MSNVGTRLDMQDKKLVFFREPQKFFYILGYNGKSIRLKVSYQWFLKRGALLYHLGLTRPTCTCSSKQGLEHYLMHPVNIF